MILSKIEQKYEHYKKIFNELEDLELSNGVIARNLLENSLYLSVFTIFENFLKLLIENYVDNVSKEGISFLKLCDGFACAVFLANEKRIKHIFAVSEEQKTTAFKSYFETIKINISKQELSKYIHFEFLHENKLNGYYKDLFEQIIGEREFLSNLKLKEECNDYEGLIEIQGDAYTFLREFTKNVRNNIAHENQTFKIDGFYSFEKVTDSFLLIMKELRNRYQKHTGFTLQENENKNLLSDF